MLGNNPNTNGGFAPQPVGGSHIARFTVGGRCQDAVVPPTYQRYRATFEDVRRELGTHALAVDHHLALGQRVLLEQAYYGDLCSSEIAAQIGKPAGAVRALLRLGLTRIGESFGIATGD